jgi:hypothetical protein
VVKSGRKSRKTQVQAAMTVVAVMMTGRRREADLDLQPKRASKVSVMLRYVSNILVRQAL